MSAFTRLGSDLWDWEPFTNLSYPARNLWLGLYTSGEAKRHVPGLWQGGLPSMADAARMHAANDVISALDELLDTEMVEYDRKTRVLRLCALPDPGEFPSNGKVIRSWWTRFNTVPACQIRDAHVATLQWIMQEGSRRKGETPSPNHIEAWDATFGRIVVPAPRRRGVQRLADSDTATSAQPSLFPSNASAVPAGNGIRSLEGSAHPQVWSHAVDNSAALHQPNKIRGPETVSDTVSDTNRIPDPGSRIPESSSLSPERGSGGGHEDRKPVLTLVYTVEDVLAVLRTGKWDPRWDDAFQEAIVSRLPSWASQGTTLDDFRVLAQHSTVFGAILHAKWLAECDLRARVVHARSTLQQREERLQMAKEFNL